MVAKQNKQINDLIFKELIKRGYSLEGNTRIWNIADSKLWYLRPDQAQSFLDLENSEAYQKYLIQKEIDLINENMNFIIKKLKGETINLVDLGCGDGKKAVLFIDKLKGNVRMRYCPIDISDYMVEKALTRIRKTDVEEVVKFQWNISDFENIENVSNLLRVGDFKKNLFLLLGNTLGNFEINELLYEVRSSMKGGDYLLIGNGLDNRHPEEILRSYNNEEVNEFLKHIPMQIGLKEKDIKLGVRFKNSRVELYYTILKDNVIEFQGKKIVLNEGDQILVSVSYKYTKEDFMSFMKLYFDDVGIWTSPDKSYALALCKK
ncbi:hypothetical protein CMI41_00550 [Candidatus Pacearchaeota archaeon]|jgi:uncharacterized SAM-dependent methyltransferase|nr:hypothetical protein [Candidatus Pacearchaeota archaeon]|tara:strand:- start:12526 stop:13482 length:957 start_codon:yes stop_codon:yes gene_type:complete